MSSANLDLSRRAIGAINGRAWEEWAGYIDPEVVYYELPGTQLDTGEVLQGRDELRAGFESWVVEFPDFRVEIDELIDAGERVVCVQRWLGTGRSSGAEMELAEVIVWTFHEGRLTEGRVHADRRAALEAVGLRE